MLALDPQRATEALEAIEESGRQAVRELQRLAGFLRSGEETTVEGPQPRIEDLHGLFSQSRAAGLPIELRPVGVRRPLPGSVELTAFRIIQESLTNVLRHAGGVPTTVVLTYLPDSLEVEVVNAPASSRHHRTDSPPGGGRGLMGMRERAAMLGGTLTSGHTRDGGYRVSAALPTATAYGIETHATRAGSE